MVVIGSGGNDFRGGRPFAPLDEWVSNVIGFMNTVKVLVSVHDLTALAHTLQTKVTASSHNASLRDLHMTVHAHRLGKKKDKSMPFGDHNGSLPIEPEAACTQTWI